MFLGNVIHPGDYYKKNPVYLENGRQLVELVARARLTDALQTSIPLLVYSTKPKPLEGDFPPVPMVIPGGAQIERIDFRLPKQPNVGDEVIYGLDLPRGCTILGTAGEKIKVAPVSLPFTPPQPFVIPSGSQYIQGSSAVLSRPNGQADQALPNLLGTLAAPLTFQISCTNTGDTGAGTGIRLSRPGVIAFIYARIIYTLPGDAIQGWGLELPIS